MFDHSYCFNRFLKLDKCAEVPHNSFPGVCKKEVKKCSSSFPLVSAVPIRDIRRSYSEMFINVFNSQDSVVLRDFFTTYYNPNVTLFRSCPSPIDDKDDCKNYCNL